jgi:hypothetical protein
MALQKGVRYTIRGVVGFIVLIVFLFMVMILSFYIGYWSDFSRQKSHLEKVGTEVVDSMFQEESFSTFPFDDDTRLNEIQLVASHNSYHKQPGPLRLFFVGLVEPDEPEKMKYSHAPLWDQFNSGVRSIELDLRFKKDEFEVVHVPLVGNRGHSPDFSLALEEIRLWSDSHPGHIPIFVLMELKSDMMALDPLLKDHSVESLQVLDDTILTVMGREKLLIPDDVRGNSESIQAAIQDQGWPLLKDTLGKVVFIMHENAEYREYYLSQTPQLEGRRMFTCGSPGDSDAAFVLHNSPDIEEIQELVQAGYIVRTRADSDLILDDAVTKTALESGAQLLTTDFPPGEPGTYSGYILNFGNGKTIRRNPVTGL